MSNGRTESGGSVRSTDDKFSLGLSIAIGVLAAAVAGIALAVFMYSQNTVWFYAYVLLGLAVGAGFHVRSQPDTWRVRSYFAVGSAFLSLFLSQYFLTRALAIDALTNDGRLLPGESVPLFVSPVSMVRIMADVFRANPVNYFVWGLALYIAYTVPSAGHRAAKKRAKAQASAG